MAQSVFQKEEAEMLVADEFWVLSDREAHILPDAELRETFCLIIRDLVGEWGYLCGPAIDMPWLKVGLDLNTLDTLSTEEMRSIVIEHQDWFYPEQHRNAPANQNVPSFEKWNLQRQKNLREMIEASKDH